MYQKLIVHKDVTDQVLIYHSADNYLIAFKKQGKRSYFLVDNNLQYMYPMEKYLARIAFSIDFEDIPDKIDFAFSTELIKIGKTACPEEIKNLLYRLDQGKMYKCYPNYYFVMLLIIALLFIVFSTAPIWISSKDEPLMKMIFFLIFFVFGCIFLGVALWVRQFYYVDKDYVIVKNIYGKIMQLNIHEVWSAIEYLPSSNRGLAKKYWICLYDNSLKKKDARFEYGYSNNKKQERIQIIYNMENVTYLEKYINLGKRIISK